MIAKSYHNLAPTRYSHSRFDSVSWSGLDGRPAGMRHTNKKMLWLQTEIGIGYYSGGAQPYACLGMTGGTTRVPPERDGLNGRIGERSRAREIKKRNDGWQASRTELTEAVYCRATGVIAGRGRPKRTGDRKNPNASYGTPWVARGHRRSPHRQSAGARQAPWPAVALPSPVGNQAARFAARVEFSRLDDGSPGRPPICTTPAPGIRHPTRTVRDARVAIVRCRDTTKTIQRPAASTHGLHTPSTSTTRRAMR